MYLVKSLPRDKGSGRYTMYLPLSPQGICRAKRADILCIYPTPCPEGGTLPDIWAIPKHIGVNTGLGVPNIIHLGCHLFMWNCNPKVPGEPENGQSPNSGEERVQKVFADIGAKGWLLWRNMGLHRRTTYLPRC